MREGGPVYMTLGQKIKKLRIESGLTQKDISERVNVTFQTVSKWENDENEPDVATLRKLASVFGCSMDYLLSEEEEKPEEEQPTSDEPVEEPQKETIVIHESEKHVCEKCGRDIEPEDIAIENITHTERYGRTTRSKVVGQRFYHKECLEEIRKERAAEARRIKAANASRARKWTYVWSIVGGVITFVVSMLIMFLVPEAHEAIKPGIAVLLSFIFSYGIFAMLFCIIAGSYIGDVFLWCSSLSIKFPGLIFSWDLGGFAWLIVMKILFAVLGFLIGVLALIFAIVFSAALGAISFPFVLLHSERHDYEDSLFD